MIRLFIFLAVLAAVAFGLSWMADRPGEIVLTWQNIRIEMSLLVGIGAICVLALLVSLAWAIFRFVFRIPSLLSLASKARRRNKGLAALSRGMIAAGSGDARQARRSADEAARHLPHEPLALLLKAQAAQLSGDRSGAETAFTAMLDRPETRLLGLRGLHVEARRRGDDVAAHDYAAQAHRIAPVPWAGQAVLEQHTGQSDWQAALETVEANLAARSIDRKTAGRQRAVLQTAIALDKALAEPDAALQLARDALKAAPGLVPAAVLAGRIYARKGDIRKAGKVLEAAWLEGPHPDIARAYLDVRPGDSTADRMTRARALARPKPAHPESLMMLARAALDTRDFAGAREAMRPLVDAGAQPTARMCLLMAQMEETEHGPTGHVRDWLARASRAPRDPAWVADGAVSDTWAPVSPVTGRLDAFEWRAPPQQLNAPLLDWQPAEALEIAPPVVLIAQDNAQLSLPDMARTPSADRQHVEANAVASAASPAALPVAAQAVAAKAMPPRGFAAPVIFPHPPAPDDPGPQSADQADHDDRAEVAEPDAAAKRRFGFIQRD